MIKRSCLLLSALSFVFLPVKTGYAADWPTYLGDCARSGVSSETLPMPLHEQWRYVPMHKPDPAWPAPAKQDFWHELRKLSPMVVYDRVYHAVVADGRLCFASSAEDNVTCLDAASGKTLWTFYTGGPVRLAPTIANDKVYFGADDGWLYCLSAAEGGLLWKYRPVETDRHFPGNGRVISSLPIRTGVVVDSGTVYFCAGLLPSHEVYCCALNADTGEVIWKEKSGELSPQGYIVASPKRLFVPNGRTNPFVLSREDATSFGQLGGGGGTFAVLTGDALASGPGLRSGHELSFSDPETNESIATCDGIRMVVEGHLAYMQSLDSIKVLDRTQFLELGRQRNAKNREREETEEALKRLQRRRKDKEEEITVLQEKLVALEAEIAQLQERMNACYLWTKPSDCPYAFIKTENLLFGGGDNKVAAFDLETGEEVWQAPTPGRVYGLSVANGTLYASTDSGTILCFGTKETTPKLLQPSPRSSLWTEDALTALYKNAVDTLLEKSQIKQGYCLVLDAEEGRLAYELAQRTQLSIIAIEEDMDKVEQMRVRFAQAGLLGTRISVHHFDQETLPYTTFMANLIVSDGVLQGHAPSLSAKEVSRLLRPYGGVALLGQSQDGQGLSAEDLQRWMGSLPDLEKAEIVTKNGVWTHLQRGAIEGAGEWTQLYANSNHTAASTETFEGPLVVQWFGEPGPRDIIDRHHRPMSSLFKNGRVYVPANDMVIAVDAYNGAPLWTLDVPESRRVGAIKHGGHMVLTDDALYIARKNECWRVDAVSGERLETFTAPQPYAEQVQDWGYINIVGDRIFGTGQRPEAAFNTLAKATVNMLEGDFRPVMISRYLFCADRFTGEEKWRYNHKSAIMNNAITIGDNRIYFIETRNEKTHDDKDGRIPINRFCKRGTHLVALSLDTGELLWEHPITLPFEHIMFLNGDQDVLLTTGSYNEKNQVRYGLFAFDMATGEALWDTSYRAMNNRYTGWAEPGGSHGEQWQHPVLIDGTIYLRPHAFDLKTGEQKEYRMCRGGHGCGGVTGSKNYLYGRGSNPRMYPLDTKATDGIPLTLVSRPGCWLNMIPAGGLLLIPESSSGCTCAYPMQTSFAFIPEKLTAAQ